MPSLHCSIIFFLVPSEVTSETLCTQNDCKFKAGNALEAEASRGVARHSRRAAPRTKECFLVSARRGMPLSELKR